MKISTNKLSISPPPYKYKGLGLVATALASVSVLGFMGSAEGAGLFFVNPYSNQNSVT